MLSAPPGQPILQFGTSRFLQAHVDLFVSEALDEQAALGGITVVQTTDSDESTARVAAMAGGAPFPIRIRGLHQGRTVDEVRTCRSVRSALRTATQWLALRREMAEGDVRVIVSNTGDAGWRLDAADGKAALDADAPAPAGFPAKLLVLLHGRWQARPADPLTVLPCELVSRNGERLGALVAGLAAAWHLPAAFLEWLREHLVWGNSLVDRIVSEPLRPVGAVAEPYALWAIERQARLVAPCRHGAISFTDDLAPVERRKLWLLNLGHTVLAELWLRAATAPDRTVFEAMNDPALRATLEGVWADEVLPVLDAFGEGAAARDYLVTLRERLANPFLAHRLADIAGNHAHKKQRRFAPVVAAGRAQSPPLSQPWLQAALAASA